MNPGNSKSPTILAGLVGHGIQLSRTPAMHETEGAALGLRYVYRLLDIEQMKPDPPSIGAILEASEICGFAGLNVTYPFKIDILQHLDILSDAAEMVGAVNTVVFRDRKRYGHNTDMWGFSESFRQEMRDARREKVLLIGAGGAGAAVAEALIQNSVANLVVRDKDPGKASELVKRINVRYGENRAVADFGTGDAVDGTDGIVNATPVGMKNSPGLPFPVEFIDPDMWVADIIYFPMETEFLRAARNKGCRTLSGSGMALFQAVRAFELFTGLKPDVARMKAAFDTFETTP